MVSIANNKLQTVIGALRECGATTVPMLLALRMKDVQGSILRHLERVNELNNELIEEYGEPNETGQSHVHPELDGWQDFVERSAELMAVKFDLGEPFVLYQKGDKFGWSEEVKTPIALTPNAMVDMGDLLNVRLEDSLEESQIAGSIAPESEVE